MTTPRLSWRWLVVVLAVLTLPWALWPAWQMWQAHPGALLQLSQQRQSMQLLQQESQTLRNKSVPNPVEAQALIQSLSKQHFGHTAVSVPGQGLQIQLRQVDAAQLALGWQDIRDQTSASVVSADLTAQGKLWSGTLVFQLAQKP
jgi:type II secretory pathway component PulM